MVLLAGVLFVLGFDEVLMNVVGLVWNFFMYLLL